jgi:ketosteroid isomerase-like protein
MRHKPISILPLIVCVCVAGDCLGAQGPSGAAVREQVLATERGFAQSMADRDQTKFSRFISAEAVFFSGKVPLRGKADIVATWSKYFKTPQAPFSWEPSQVEVLDSGTLALSTGPVKDPHGKHIGTFTSIWRLEAGTWRIVFDKGNEACGP